MSETLSHEEPQHETQSPQRPAASKQFDRVKTAIWRCESSNIANQQSKPYFTVTQKRSYRNDKGEWVDTTTWTERDLPHVRLGLDWAMRELLLMDE